LSDAQGLGGMRVLRVFGVFGFVRTFGFVRVCTRQAALSVLSARLAEAGLVRRRELAQHLAVGE
jgi:hypothetical protein